MDAWLSRFLLSAWAALLLASPFTADIADSYSKSDALRIPLMIVPMPFCAAHILPNKQQQEKAFEFVTAFAAPYSMKMLEIDAVGMYDSAAEEMGKIFITTELGGGGTATAKSAAIATPNSCASYSELRAMRPPGAFFSPAC